LFIFCEWLAYEPTANRERQVTGDDFRTLNYRNWPYAARRTASAALLKLFLRQGTSSTQRRRPDFAFGGMLD
jgi:hypothetical protein